MEEWNNPSEFVEVKTSGSTGEPKRMMVEKRRMLNSARITCDFLGLRKGDTALLCMSTDYIAGKMMVVRSIERGLRLISVEPSGHPLSSLLRPPLTPPARLSCLASDQRSSGRLARPRTQEGIFLLPLDGCGWF